VTPPRKIKQSLGIENPNAENFRGIKQTELAGGGGKLQGGKSTRIQKKPKKEGKRGEGT